MGRNRDPPMRKAAITNWYKHLTTRRKLMNEKFQAAQGDLCVTETNNDQDYHFAREDNNIITDGVVAHGESGHFHRIKDTTAVKIVTIMTGLVLVKVLRETELIHEEHGPVPLEAGKTYEIQRQREVDLVGDVHLVRD